MNTKRQTHKFDFESKEGQSRESEGEKKEMNNHGCDHSKWIQRERSTFTQ